MQLKAWLEYEGDSLIIIIFLQVIISLKMMLLEYVCTENQFKNIMSVLSVVIY